jgi:hypothetical protein
MPERPRDPQSVDGSGGGDDPADMAALERYATGLVDAVDAALPGWVERSVLRVLSTQGLLLDEDGRRRLTEAREAARSEGATRLRELLAQDIDAQRSNPLAVLRSLVRHPAGVLQAAGAHPVDRDEFARNSFPDDDYDLAPASFADVDQDLHEPGLLWGAAKAHIHLARRRRAGQR